MKQIAAQTLALFHDAYRELNSKRMFWISLIISGLVVMIFLTIGISADGALTLFGMKTPLPLPFSKAELYKLAFNNLGVGLWLTFVGAVLAVISTAGIFPDLITSGSIDLYLSKPIGRLRLFLTKYAAGLLFVTIQVVVFCTASFIVIGLRSDLWEPRLFIAVPVVVCFFSYIYCVTVLVGLLTRSTTAAVLLSMLFWFLVWGLDRGEIVLLIGKTYGEEQQHAMDVRLVDQKENVLKLKAKPNPTAADLDTLRRKEQILQDSQKEDGDNRPSYRNVAIAHTIVYDLKTLLPKTRETNEVLDRILLNADELKEYDAHHRPGSAGLRLRPRNPERGGPPPWLQPEFIQQAQDQMRRRPLTWVIGTSLIFEAIIVAWAAWVFCRRDY